MTIYVRVHYYIIYIVCFIYSYLIYVGYLSIIGKDNILMDYCYLCIIYNSYYH